MPADGAAPTGEPMLVLMHGDREVSTKQLARYLGRKTVQPCDAAVAQRHTGYMVGGTSPFGTRKPLAVFIEQSILDLPRACLNGGRRGLLVRIDPSVITRTLGATPVNVALDTLGLFVISLSAGRGPSMPAVYDAAR